MKKSVYLRGTTGRYWYNFTELLAMTILHRPIPEGINLSKIKYGKEKLQYINLFSPKNAENKKKPLFIYVHGGGWISGITDMRNTYVSQWADLGFFAASISYSYAPDKVFPQQLHEIFKAIDFLLDRADRYGIDTDNIIVAGESAGGYYISYLAACCSDKSLYDKLKIDFKHKDSFKISALVSICGCYNLQSLTDKSKPQSKFPDIKMMVSSFVGEDFEGTRKILNGENGEIYSPKITSGFPPTFIVWAVSDYLRYEAFDLEKTLTDLGVPNKLYKADGIISMHAWAIATIVKKGRTCLNEAFDFTLPYITSFEKKNGKWELK